MLSVFDSDLESKDLYFKISNSLNIINSTHNGNFKTAGIYAIFRGDTCHYVGQSKNIASRLSTHLSGKYKNATSVKLFFAGETDGYECNSEEFYFKSKDDQTESLTKNESLCMSVFKPIENIHIHGDGKGCQEWILTPSEPSAFLDLSQHTISIYRDIMCIDNASSEILDFYNSYHLSLKGEE